MISTGSIGSAPFWPCRDMVAATEAFEERAAIMEFEGGLDRADAERAARVLVVALGARIEDEDNDSGQPKESEKQGG